MTDIRTRLTHALRVHSDYDTGCQCGTELDYDDGNAHAAHLADVLLALPGIAIVELPEPDSERYEGDEHEPEDRLCWLPGDDFETSVWNQGEVQRCGFGWGDLEPLSLAEARTVAAALLAAANAAEAMK